MATSYDVNAEAEERAAEADRLTAGAGHDPAGDPAAQPRRGARWRRQREDRARAAAGQGADPRTRTTARRSGSRCSATRSGSPSTSSARSATWRRKDRPAFVGTFHEFGGSGAPRTATARTATSGRTTLPAADGRPRARTSTDKQKYDAVIVDEAQDFADTWWRPVLQGAARRGSRAGSTSTPTRTSGSSRASAGRRCRWSRWCSTTTCATPSRSTSRSGRWRRARMYARGGDGPDGAVRGQRRPTRRSTRPTTRSTRCSTRAGARRTSPCSPPATGTPIQVERDRLPRPGRLLADVLGRGRGLLRPRPRLQGSRAARPSCCASTRSKERDRARERLYVGMSRATDELVVVGDPESDQGDRRPRGGEEAGDLMPHRARDACEQRRSPVT